MALYFCQNIQAQGIDQWELSLLFPHFFFGGGGINLFIFVTKRGILLYPNDMISILGEGGGRGRGHHIVIVIRTTSLIHHLYARDGHKKDDQLNKTEATTNEKEEKRRNYRRTREREGRGGRRCREEEEEGRERSAAGRVGWRWGGGGEAGGRVKRPAWWRWRRWRGNEV